MQVEDECCRLGIDAGVVVVQGVMLVGEGMLMRILLWGWEGWLVSRVRSGQHVGQVLCALLEWD